MTLLTTSDMTSLMTSMIDGDEQTAACQNGGDVYSSIQFQTATVSARSVPAVSQTSTVTLSALSLAADPEQLSAALARLVVSSPGRYAAAVTTAPLDDVVGHRPRRPVDRSASEPLSSSSAAVEAGAFCRYKTELCRPFEENGACKYGDKCQFAHGRAELRPIVRHPKYKTDLCKTYHTTGLCPYGPRCHFIHNDDERHLNGLNRIVIEQQKALMKALMVQRQQKQVLVEALARRRQLVDAVAALSGKSSRGSAVASRSPSPHKPTATVSAGVVCADETTSASEFLSSLLAALAHRVRQAVPHLTDAQVQTVVTRLLMGAVVSDGYQHTRPHQTQLQHHYVRHHHHQQQQQLL